MFDFIRPTHRWGHYTFGCALAQESQFPKAISELEIAQRLEPTNEVIYQQLQEAEKMARIGSALESVPPKGHCPKAQLP